MGQVLKSLKDFERERMEFYMAKQRGLVGGNGIACPECGGELQDESAIAVSMSNPPRKAIVCPACRWIGSRLR